MTRPYQQYLRAYAIVLSDGLVKCDLMTNEGMDAAAIAYGVLHAKRALSNPNLCPANASDFAALMARNTQDPATA